MDFKRGRQRSAWIARLGFASSRVVPRDQVEDHAMREVIEMDKDAAGRRREECAFSRACLWMTRVCWGPEVAPAAVARRLGLVELQLAVGTSLL